MNKYLLLFRGSLEQEKSFSPEVMQRYMMEWMDWMANMQEKGVYLGGDPLQPQGLTLSGKDTLLTDGPYAEAKDLVGGYMLLKAENLDAARDEALNCPIFRANGTVEVRPIQELELHGKSG